MDDSEPTPFTYAYALTGAARFSLRVQFKLDRWDEYDLTFASGRTGQFVRREFDKHALKDTDSGPFTVAPNVQ